MSASSVDTRQCRDDETNRAWLRRRVLEILDGDGVTINIRSIVDTRGVTLHLAQDDKPSGTVTLDVQSGLLRVSLGKKPGELFPEQVMQLAGGAVLKAQGLGLASVQVNLGDDKIDPHHVVMGIQSALLRADELKTGMEDFGVREVNVALREGEQSVQDALFLARTSNAARWLAALPPNLLGVDEFHQLLLDLFSEQEDVTLLGVDGQPDDTEYARMGLLNAVAQGNGGSRRVFAIRIDPASGATDKVVAYVGKSLVYDSGGYSLKPSPSMRTMKGDMTGGACLVGAALYLMAHRSQLKRSVVFVWTITKNMVGSDGYVPDDVVCGFSGKTVEIDNTDAEGRLALADAMAWICTKVPVSQLVSVCTLTGAAVIALGTAATAMHLRNSRRRVDEVGKLEELSFQVGDPVNILHHFGLGAEILGSKIADHKNAGGGKKGAGSQQGFAFLLAHAPDDVDVMELDIAGSAGDFSDTDGIQLGTSRPAGTWFIIALETHGDLFQEEITQA